MVVFGFNVNSWGRDKIQIIASRVGEESPARFLCIGEQDSVSEITEITHTKADTFQHFGFVVAAFNEAVRPRDIHNADLQCVPQSLVRRILGIQRYPGHSFRELGR